MESYELGLVAELCKSRNDLMRQFPCAIREIRFLTTIPRGFRRHPVVLWAGAWLYWLIGQGYTRFAFRRHRGVESSMNHSIGGLEHSDAFR